MENPKNNKNHEIFWIELKETNSGHQILSAVIKSQHWKGFLENKEMKNGSGKTWTKKEALMKPCSWEACKVCHPNNIVIKQTIAKKD